MTEPDMTKKGIASIEKEPVELMTFWRIVQGWTEVLMK